MVLTAAGLVAIEKIKAGDVVISTDPDTLETAEKPVLETYVRQVDKLVHLTINGEEIVTTVDHPFYVQGKGFINAGNLLVGDRLVSVNGEDLSVDDCYIEECDFPTTVYNFQVEDYHTYFVGQSAVWVHNANYDEAVTYLSKNSKPGRKTKGKTELQIKDGDYNDALRDFEAVAPSEPQTIYTKYGEGKTGTLSDGSTITARQGSSDGRPTLELRKSNGRGVEYRYGEQGS
jgi:hypothetical protein